MAQLAATMNTEESQQQQSQTSVESTADEERQPSEFRRSGEIEKPPDFDHTEYSQITTSPLLSPTVRHEGQARSRAAVVHNQDVTALRLESDNIPASGPPQRPSRACKRSYEEFAAPKEKLTGDEHGAGESTAEDDTSHPLDSQESALSARRLEVRRNAFSVMNGATSGQHVWTGLLSTTGNHTHLEIELGEE